MMHHASKTTRFARRGTVLVAVLLFTAVILMLVTTMAGQLTRDHRQTRIAEQELQACWLAESAVQRAVRSLQESPDYAGETWQVPAAILGAGEAARVEIRVEPPGEEAADRRLRIEVRYPDHPTQRVLEICELQVAVPAEP
jgi:Tfp pilus assembly protein PilX